MSTVSSIGFAIQDILVELRDSYVWQFARLPFSVLLTVPTMTLSSGSQFHLAVMFLFSVALSLAAFSSSSSQESSQLPTGSVSAPALRALSKFLIPTSSIWPVAYLDIARSAEELPRNNTIHLKLELIFREIRQGIIELRNPLEDLPHLIKGQLQHDEWNFKLDISWRNRMRIWTWVFSDELSSFPEEVCVMFVPPEEC